MHISGKILMGIGVVMLLAGGGLAWISGGSIEDARTNWAMEGTSGQVELTDEDGAGEIGFAFFIEGEYNDIDENGQWDDCESFTATFTGPAESEDDYFTLVCDEGLRDNSTRNTDYEAEGLIYVGIACTLFLDQNCPDGTYNITTNQEAKVIYADAALGDLIEGIFGAFGGIVCACCGIALAILGLILGLTINTQPPTQIVVPGQQMSGQPAMVEPSVSNPFEKL